MALHRPTQRGGTTSAHPSGVALHRPTQRDSHGVTTHLCIPVSSAHYSRPSDCQSRDQYSQPPVVADHWTVSRGDQYSQPPVVVDHWTLSRGDQYSQPPVVEDNWTLSLGDQYSQPPVVVDHWTLSRGDQYSQPPVVVDHQTVSRGDQYSKPSVALSKLGQFCSPNFACLSEETLKAVGPFYLVLKASKVKDPTQGNGNKLVVDSVCLTELVSKLTTT